MENKIIYLIGTPHPNPKIGPISYITPYMGNNPTGKRSLEEAITHLHQVRKHTKRKGYKLYIITEHEEMENP